MESNQAQAATEQRVKQVLLQHLPIEADELLLEASLFEDLGADSADALDVLMALEEEFDIEIPDEDAEKLNTVGQIVKYIHKKISN